MLWCRAVIAWAKDFLPRRRPVIRLRMPGSMLLFPGSTKESIDATFDEGGRIVQLIVHTRSKNLNARVPSRWS